MSTTAERPATIETRNPATDEVLARYEPHAKDAIDARLDAAGRGSRAWRDASFAQRRERIRAAARYLR
jgi:succinate-semialdehyde dehydrogenase / glutarate-semialdehyde dehydrogenase